MVIVRILLNSWTPHLINQLLICRVLNLGFDNERIYHPTGNIAAQIQCFDKLSQLRRPGEKKNHILAVGQALNVLRPHLWSLFLTRKLVHKSFYRPNELKKTIRYAKVFWFCVHMLINVNSPVIYLCALSPLMVHLHLATPTKLHKRAKLTELLQKMHI